MDRNKTTLERAFELAESGECGNVTNLRARLKSEGYDLRQLIGPALNKQLIQIMEKATTSTPPDLKARSAPPT
jgi:hypothetical protein